MMEIESQPQVVAETPVRALSVEGDSDADLVTWMTLREEDEELAFDACEALYKRHGPLLLGWSQQNAGNIFGEAAEDFVNATFRKAFDCAETFRCPSHATAEEQRKRVVGWLFQILQNLLKDSFKAEAREREFRDQNVEVAELPNEEQFEFPREDDVTIETQLSRRALLARDFLETEISEDDHYLLQLSANFFDFTRNEPAIDPDLLEGAYQRMGLEAIS